MSAQSTSAKDDRVVALVVSVGQGEARADSIQAQLQAMGAETLRSIDPTNAELRSMVRRFADEAEDARATFVYIDMPAVTFEGREYVIPAGAALLSYQAGTARATDIFTLAIPLLAFARTAAQAEQGGAVVLTVNKSLDALPQGISQVVQAPDTVAGASSILVVSDVNAAPVLQIFTTASQEESVEINAIFRQMDVHEGVSVSAFPQAPIFLKTPPELEGAPASIIQVPTTSGPDLTQPPETSEVIEQSDVAPPFQASVDPETLEALEILERAMSRSAKRAIQRRLRDLGHYKGLVDGIFGPQTRKAIAAFQTVRSEEQTGQLNRQQLIDLTKSE